MTSWTLPWTAGRSARRLLLAIGVLPGALLAQTPAALTREGRAQLDEIQPDSAATLLARALEPSRSATVPEQVRAWTLLGIAELMRGQTVTARQAFRRALERDPALRVDSLAFLHSSVRLTFAAEREAYRLETDEGPPAIAVRTPADTVIASVPARFAFEVQPRRRARVIASIAPGTDPRAAPVWADTLLVTQVGGFSWELLGRSGTAAAGRYTLRVVATDTLGRSSPVTSRTLFVSRVPVDTAATPDLPDDALLPESTATRPVGGVLTGIVLGAGVVLMTTVAGNAALNHGEPRAAPFVVAGAISTAAIAGFLGRRREHPLPQNAAPNQELRAEVERQRRDVAANNRRLLALAPIRVRVELAR